MKTATNSDTRFFPGYIWVSMDSDCKLGLCFKADDEREAAQKMVPSRWWLKGKTFTVYTMKEAHSLPVRHDITIA